MTNKKIQLSIIIVNYNVKEYLIRCINSIYNHIKEIKFEIIIIDNNSSDGSADLITNKFPEIIFLKNNFNAGFSAANNQGIAKSQGEYIFLLNPDTCLVDDHFVKMFLFINENEKNVLVSPRLLNTDGTIQHSAWKKIAAIDILLETVLFKKSFYNKYPLENYFTPQAIDTTAGAAMLFSKNLIDSIGYLDENFFYSEDDEFCQRIRNNGGIIYYFPGMSIVHHGKRSALQNIKISYANATISKLKYYKKHQSSSKAFLVKIFIFIHIITRLCILPILFPLKKKFRQQLFAYIFTFQMYFRYLYDEKILIT